jgi:type IV pilus assembly protein PilX
MKGMKEMSRKNVIHASLPRRQQGAVLLVSLIVLLVMTLAALSSSRSILLQEKMTGAVRESHLAFQAAESAIRDAEEYLEEIVSTGGFNNDGNNGLYAMGAAPIKADIWGHANWSDSTKYIEAVTANSSGVPLGKYMVELISTDIASTGDSGDINKLNVDQDYATQGSQITGFRVTARGESRDGKSVSIVQAYYGKRL